MNVGTALVLIALGVFFYLKPKVFKWSMVGLGVCVIAAGIALYINQLPPSLPKEPVLCNLRYPVYGCINAPAPWEQYNNTQPNNPPH
jgi:uncharacterized membrane protein YczE